MFELAEELKQVGLYLEDFAAWLGEPAPYKFIVLSSAGQHIAYANTLAGVRKALAKEKRIQKRKRLPSREECQLSIF